MFDIATIGAALGSLRTLVDFAKNAKDGSLAFKISTAVADVQGRLLDVQGQALALQAENQELKHQLRKLNDEKEFRDSLTYDARGIYFRTSNPQEAYCSACLDSDHKRTRLLVHDGGSYCCDFHAYRQ